MLDAHTHLPQADCLMVETQSGAILKRFFGIHPWNAETDDLARVEAAIAADPAAGVGEIGLDRLKTKTVTERQREVFAAQLELAAKYGRVATLHGAKCWGEVVKAAKPYAGRIPAFIFHGFSRSAGLLGEIRAMNGVVSVGPAVLNDHAVNYRKLVAGIPDDMLLLETDGQDVSIDDICAKVAEIRGTTVEHIAGLQPDFQL